jgi:hypothetical protein
MNDIEFLGWLLLCVIPPEGDRYAVHLRTMIRRDRLAPVLPVALRRSRPTEIEIAWDDAPVVRELDQAEPFEIESEEDEGVGDETAEAEVVLAATDPADEAEKPKPRRAARRPAPRNGTPATPKKKPPPSSNGKPAGGQAKPRTRARADRTGSSGGGA